MKFATGCKPCPDSAKGDTSLPDLLGAGASSSPPPTLNLGRLVKRIRNQNPFGLCVGFGSGQAMYNCAAQAGHEDMDYPSALGNYRQARAYDRILKLPTDGASIDSCLRAVAAGGYILERDMPYKPEDRFKGFKLGQGQVALRKAGLKTHRIDTWAPNFEKTVKTLLANRKGIVGGWLVDEPFEDWTPDQPLWDGATRDGEGHCMAVLDYPQGFPRLVNSWGEAVGDGGLWTITWRALKKALSLWAIDFVPIGPTS